MGKYIVKRVLLAVVSILIVSAITFFVMNIIPGGPFNKEKATSAEAQKVLEERYNLDKPIPEQYVIYMNNLLHGDWGVSLHSGRDIWGEISSRFKVSAKLGGMAALVAIVVGLVLGSIAALTRNHWPDRLIVFFTTLGTAMPSFVLATLLLLVFCLKLGWFPVWSSTSPNYVLPIIALSVYPMAYITRLTKTSMLDSLNQDYIRTARAKGVPGWKVIFKHALRNALMPVVTMVGMNFGVLLGGTVTMEAVFTLNGVGTLILTSIRSKDIPVVIGAIVILAVCYTLVMLVVDILYGFIDPQIKARYLKR